MKLYLLKDFNCIFPDAFISFIETNFPSLCMKTVNNKSDFNRWSITLRESRDLKNAIKLYETKYNLLSDIFVRTEIRASEKGFILVNSETNEEYWEPRD